MTYGCQKWALDAGRLWLICAESLHVKWPKRPCLQAFLSGASAKLSFVIAWAAGLYEGEGTATRCKGRLRLPVRMTNEETARRFADVVRCGTVYGPYKYHRSPDGYVRKPVWVWLAECEEAWTVADLLRPWLSTERRVQLERVFRAEA